MEHLLKYKEIQNALQFLKEDDDRTLQETLEMCQIPAPSYQEEKKAAYVLAKMKEAGLEDVHIDEVGNVLGTRKGTGNGPRIMIAGHTDTVFPMETDLTLKKEGNRYSCPGIGDDTRAVAELLGIARAMKAADVRGNGDIVFCANVCEEGLGDLRGSKYAFHVLPPENTEKAESVEIAENKENIENTGITEAKRTESYDGFISIDDKHTAGIIYQAVGSERYQVTFHGTGGHSYTGFGIPNPIHAMGRAIAKISDFQVPKNPKVTFSVGVVNGGTSVNVIAAEASMLMDMRSVDAKALSELSAKFHRAIEEAVAEENARWGYKTFDAADDEINLEKLGDGTTVKETCANARTDKNDCITVTIEQKGRRPAGIQEKDCLIVQAANAANETLGLETLYIDAASTDANIPISLGIPAITVGFGGKGGGEHTIHEWYEQEESYKGPQRDLLLLLALSGYKEEIKYQLSSK